MTQVFVGVGHGRRPDGTYDPGTRNRQTGAVEHEQAHRVVEVVDAGLDRCGVTHVTEAWGSAAFDDPNFHGSIETANEAGVDLALEVHFDWDQAPRGGFGIFYPGSAGGERAAADIGAAHAGQGQRLRYGGTYEDTRGLAFVRRAAAPAVIWECDRIDVYDDETVGAFGEAIVEGVCTFLGADYVAPGGAVDDFEEFLMSLPDEQQTFLRRFAEQGVADGVDGQSYAREVLKTHRGVTEVFAAIKAMDTSPVALAEHGVAALRELKTRGLRTVLPGQVPENKTYSRSDLGI